MTSSSNKRPAVRLVLRWSDDGWDVADRIDLPDKALPPSDDLPQVPAGRSVYGFWYELQDEQGNVLYRRIGLDPFVVLTQAGPRALSPDEVVVQVLVPDLPGASRLVVWSPDPPSDQREVLGRASRRTASIALAGEDARGRK